MNMDDYVNIECGSVVAIDKKKVPFLHFFKKEVPVSIIVRTDDGKIQVVKYIGGK